MSGLHYPAEAVGQQISLPPSFSNFKNLEFCLVYVTALSSVSAGSLTAAYYGLFHDDQTRWNPKDMKDIKDKLRQDFELDSPSLSVSP